MEEFSAAGFAEYLNLLCKIFQDGQQSGVFRKELNPKIAAKMFFGALDEMATNWIISKRHYKLEPMADLVMDVFLNGVSS
jgi:TetR/AcrR family fatty acid metabolism transcriptional regulator